MTPRRVLHPGDSLPCVGGPWAGQKLAIVFFLSEVYGGKCPAILFRVVESGGWYRLNDERTAFCYMTEAATEPEAKE